MYCLITRFSILALLAYTPLCAAYSRSLWFWETDLLLKDVEVTKFLSFAQTYNISTVYALADRGMGNAPFEKFIRKCTAQNVSVQALMGDAQWIVGGGSPSLDTGLAWLSNYQSSVAADAKFSGVHIDVEPHTLPDWETNKAKYTSSLVAIATKVKTVATGLNIKAAADLVFWANEIAIPNTNLALSDWAVQNLDAAAFMTYRNKPAALLDVGKAALEAGVKAGKPRSVWLSIETGDVGSDNALISYFGMTKAQVLADMDIVAAGAEKYQSFAGIAIHYYSGFVALK